MDQINPYASPGTTDTAQVPTVPQVSFGGILNNGLRLYINNFPAILLVTLVVWTPTSLFQSYMDYFVFDADDLRSTFRLQQVLQACVGIIATAAVIAIGDAAMRNERLSAWEALGEGLSAWPRMFWSRFLANLLLLFAFLALVIPGIYVYFRLALLEPVAVIEHRSGGGCIDRAFQLTRKRFWLMFGLLGGAYAAVLLIAFTIAMPTAIFPEIDHWLVDASQSLFVEILEPAVTTILVAAYFACQHDTQLAALQLLPSSSDNPAPPFAPLGEAAK